MSSTSKQRITYAYEEIERTRERLHEAYEERDDEEFARHLAQYTQAVLDGVRAVQSPMWGPDYTVDPRTLAPDGFGDDTISRQARIEHAEQGGLPAPVVAGEHELADRIFGAGTGDRLAARARQDKGCTHPEGEACFPEVRPRPTATTEEPTA